MAARSEISEVHPKGPTVPGPRLKSLARPEEQVWSARSASHLVFAKCARLGVVDRRVPGRARPADLLCRGRGNRRCACWPSDPRRLANAPALPFASAEQPPMRTSLSLLDDRDGVVSSSVAECCIARAVRESTPRGLHGAPTPCCFRRRCGCGRHRRPTIGAAFDGRNASRPKGPSASAPAANRALVVRECSHRGGAGALGVDQ
jgi:hypothetical protein